jgi:GNAT superfamily N-acetyltransferase
MIKYEEFLLEDTSLESWHQGSIALTNSDSDNINEGLDFIKDSDGKPKKFYHGTDTKFKQFKIEKTNDGVFWFSENKDKIKNGEAGAQGTSIIMTVNLKASKIAGWDEYDKYSIDELIQQGYDAIKLDDDIVIFHPNQIKILNTNILEYNEFVIETSNIHDLQQELSDKYTSAGLKDISLFLSNNNIKLNMIAVEKDKQKQGLGTKVLDDIVHYADTNKLDIYLTTGVKDDNFGTTSSERLKKFYKRFGFVENKGSNKDFSISGNMYRKHT